MNFYPSDGQPINKMFKRLTVQSSIGRKKQSKVPQTFNMVSWYLRVVEDRCVIKPPVQEEELDQVEREFAGMMMS